MNTVKTLTEIGLQDSHRPVPGTSSTHAAHHPRGVRAHDATFDLSAENTRLKEEVARLRRENDDLRASADLWIQCYEAACRRCRDGRRS
jgi:hypothetical protein